jgi:hypothetical protein
VAAGVPAIESGTAGYLGQVQVIRKVAAPYSTLDSLHTLDLTLDPRTDPLLLSTPPYLSDDSNE